MPSNVGGPAEPAQQPRFGRIRWWVEESPAAFTTAVVVCILLALVMWLTSLWSLDQPVTELRVSLQPVASPSVPMPETPAAEGVEEVVPEIAVDVPPEAPVDPPEPEIDLELSPPSTVPKAAEALRAEAEEARRYMEQLAAAAHGEARPASDAAADPDSTMARVARWIIQYPPVDVLEYARLLDQFDVELGWVEGPRIEYVSRLSGPVRRRTGTLRAENRIFWFPVDGSVPQDELLLQRLKITPGGTIIHFYPKRVERMLARLEREALRKHHGIRDLTRVARTVFAFRRVQGRWKFIVKSIELRVDPVTQADHATDD